MQQNDNLDDYPMSALVYAIAASLGLTAAGVAIAIAWGHSMSQAILHGHG